MRELNASDLVNELQGFDKWFFKMMFTGKTYRKIYRLVELDKLHDGKEDNR